MTETLQSHLQIPDITEQETERLCKIAKAVLRTEAEAIQHLEPIIDHNFARACLLLHQTLGRVIVIGMGKSGHVGRKIAATMASTGTPAFFVHPGEASHGDLGMITSSDRVLAISYSGETPELLDIIPLIKRLNVPLLALCGNPNSTLAKAANIFLNVKIEKEGCPLGLAPTASTTATLALGDALAIALLDFHGFTEDDFALLHPGGSLGRRLLLYVDEIMHSGNEIPIVTQDCLLKQALLEISNKRLGMTTVVNQDQQLIGMFTDGDLRRTLDMNYDINSVKMCDVMTHHCRTLKPKTLAAKALQVMDENKITALPIVDENNIVLGIVHMHDLLEAGVY